MLTSSYELIKVLYHADKLHLILKFEETNITTIGGQLVERHPTETP